jgi:hypothetical protein
MQAQGAWYDQAKRDVPSTRQLAPILGPFAPLGRAAGLILHNMYNYDLNKQNRLASQSFSRRNGMYNPQD